MKKILFSCIGDTDPMNLINLYDGPMLHIARHHKPDEIYLYLSQKMVDLYQNNNIYLPYIQDLARRMGKEIEVHPIFRPDLADPHKFDSFYQDFRDIIEAIHKKNPSAEILLNTSSGTPAMKAGLQNLVSFFSFKTRPIQVSSPKPGTHDSVKKEEATIDNYDTGWELNLDHNENSQDRTRVQENINLNFEIKCNLIKEFVNEENYKAALAVAKGIEELLDPRAIDLIAYQEARKDLDETRVIQVKSRLRGEDLNYLNDTKPRRMVEYFLKWQSDTRAGNYQSFAIGLTPILSYMQKRTLEIKVAGQGEIVEDPRWGEQTFGPSLMEYIRQKRDLAPSEWKSYGFISSYQMNDLIQANPEVDRELKENLAILREIEGKMRNTVAHQVVTVSREAIEKQMQFETAPLRDVLSLGLLKKSYLSYSVDQVLSLTWDIICRLYPSLKNKKKHYREDYTGMNERIIGCLKQK